jgi:hypothetical protein
MSLSIDYFCLFLPIYYGSYQLIVIYFTLLYDFLTSKAVKCFVCLEESDQKAINPNSTALGVTLFVLVVLIMFAYLTYRRRQKVSIMII